MFGEMNLDLKKLGVRSVYTTNEPGSNPAGLQILQNGN